MIFGFAKGGFAKSLTKIRFQRSERKASKKWEETSKNEQKWGEKSENVSFWQKEIKTRKNEQKRANMSKKWRLCCVQMSAGFCSSPLILSNVLGDFAANLILLIFRFRYHRINLCKTFRPCLLLTTTFSILQSWISVTCKVCVGAISNFWEAQDL